MRAYGFELHGRSACGNQLFNTLYNMSFLPLCGRLFLCDQIKTPRSQLTSNKYFTANHTKLR